MHKSFNKYCVYTPVTLLKGENVFRYYRWLSRTQWLTLEEIQELQVRKVREVLEYAVQNTPYYRSRMSDLLQGGWLPNKLTDLNELPILDKNTVASQKNELCSYRWKWFITQKTTGGSTGRAVTIPKDAQALAIERAATWRAYRWVGIDIGDRQARFWGVPLLRGKRWQARVTDWIANRRRLSAFEIDDESLTRYYEVLHRFKPKYLYGYLSIMREFADFLVKRNLKVPHSVVAIICTAEVLDAATRQRLNQVFGVPVYNEYGCGEVGSIAHECEYGQLHIMAENVIVQTESGNESNGGELLITDLHNRAMPLIRYKLGDYAVLSSQKCSCNRGLPILEKIYGRAFDLIIDPDGVRHHPELVMYIFEHIRNAGCNVDGFQVVQTDLDCLEVYLTGVEESERESIEALIGHMMRTKLHPSMRVKYHYVSRIRREQSGKLRLVQSELRDIVSIA